MGGGTADERLEPIVEHGLQEMASLPIPDELMAEILLRLPTIADLARASAACASFGLVATARPFLRRFRKLHPAPLLGLLQEGRAKRKIFRPAAPPYPSAREASAASLAADFSFSFLPAPAGDWALRDTRDGRVLLDRPMRVHDTTGVVFPEVVVCDPLHRRYLLLPPIPDHLAASVEDPFINKKSQLRGVEVFLVPTEDAETADETSFRVIWMAQCKATLVTFVFSSSTGKWRAIPSRRWSDLSACMPPLMAGVPFYSLRYVYGCFYWGTDEDYFEECKLLVLDIKTMDFSIAEPPPEVHGCCSYFMVETGEGRPGMFVLEICGTKLSCFIRKNDGQSSSRWQKVKTISLASWAQLVCNMEKFPLLYLGKSALLEAGCFTLDMETFQFEEVCAFDFGSSFGKLQAYSNFPPSLLSFPTISSGVEKGSDKEMLEQGCAASSSTELPQSE